MIVDLFNFLCVSFDSICVWTRFSVAGVPQSAAGGFCCPGHPDYAPEALPDATHVHHGVIDLLQAGLSLSDAQKTKQRNSFWYCFTYKVSSLHKYNEHVLSLQLFGWIGEKFKQHTVVFAVLAIMAIQGMTNLQAQWAIIGEFSNLPQEELLDWIQENTRPSEWPCLLSSLPSKRLWWLSF